MSRLDKLKKAFSKETTGSNDSPFYRFYDMPEGEQAEVRFLPDKNEDNPLGFLVEKKVHVLTVNGQKKNVPCLQSYGEDCPICKVSKDYYDAGDKENGKKYWRKISHIAQVLVVKDPTGGEHENKVMPINISYQIYNPIMSAFQDDEMEEVPFEFKGGTNFFIKKEKQGEYFNYTTSKFSRKESDLSDQVIEMVESQLRDLRDFLPSHPGTERVQQMLEADLAGIEYQENTGSDYQIKTTSNLEAKVKASSAKAEKKVDVNLDSDEDEELSVDSAAEALLAQLKARNKG